MIHTCILEKLWSSSAGNGVAIVIATIQPWFDVATGGSALLTMRIHADFGHLYKTITFNLQ
jgi:hypothetical protein